jgi:hypothetical protein
MYTDSAPKSILEWTHLLSISTNFKFSRLRQLAIQELSTNYTLHPVEKIVLSKTYDIPDWFQPAFEELVQRDVGPRQWESEKLGLKTTVEIYMAREDARQVKEDLDQPGIAGLIFPSVVRLPGSLLSPSSSPRVASSGDLPAEVACSVHEPSETDLETTQCTAAGVTSAEDSTSVDDEQDRTDGDTLKPTFGVLLPFKFSRSIT